MLGGTTEKEVTEIGLKKIPIVDDKWQEENSFFFLLRLKQRGQEFVYKIFTSHRICTAAIIFLNVLLVFLKGVDAIDIDFIFNRYYCNVFIEHL